MLADLDRVIRLQKLDSFAEDARQRIADHPRRTQALDARLSEARGAVEAAAARLADNQAARRNDERDVAGAQARLAKYKDQLLEVKTNREYQAMQHEIAAAQTEVSRHEDRILERMLEADELSRAARQADQAMATVQREVDQERSTLDAEIRQLESEIEKTATTRGALAAEISPAVLATFDTVARGRKGVAVAEARDGLCSVCHVRIRPQVYNNVRQNAAIIQCDSCQRILYFAGAPAASSAAAAGPAAS